MGAGKVRENMYKRDGAQLRELIWEKKQKRGGNKNLQLKEDLSLNSCLLCAYVHSKLKLDILFTSFNGLSNFN